MKITVTLELDSRGVQVARTNTSTERAFAGLISLDLIAVIQGALAGSAAGALTLPHDYGSVRYRVDEP